MIVYRLVALLDSSILRRNFQIVAEQLSVSCHCPRYSIHEVMCVSPFLVLLVLIVSGSAAACDMKLLESRKHISVNSVLR